MTETVQSAGRYYLRVKFGEDDIFLNPSTLRSCTIVQDLNKFLPMFELSIVDGTGNLIHILPFDSGMSKVYVEWAEDYASKIRNSATFDVYRRKPEADQPQLYGIYNINGLLERKNLFSPDKSRGFSGTITSTLEQIGAELGVDSTEIGSSLEYDKTIVQPLWANIHLLKYLKDNLVGSNGECGYRSFVKVKDGKVSFVFKSLDEFISQAVAYKFVLKDTPYEDCYPLYAYSILDNYKAQTVLSASAQPFGYFDFMSGAYVEDNEAIQDYISLSDYFLVDKDDLADDGTFICETGRSNDFTSDFRGMVKGSYYGRITNLVKMWATTRGIPNICPGDVVQMFFPVGTDGQQLYSHQYSGYWLVERTVQMFGDTYLTRLLLTRTGIDTDIKNTLVKADRKKTV